MKERNIYLLEMIIFVFIIVSRAFYYSYIDEKLELQSHESKTNQENMMYSTIVMQMDVIGLRLQNLTNKNFIEDGILKSRVDIINNLYNAQAEMKDVSALYVAFENGQCYATHDRANEFKGISSEEWYLNAKRNNDLVLTGKKVNNSNECVGILSLPLIDHNGNFYGVIAAEMDENIYRNTIRAFEAYIEQIILKDKNGNNFYIYDHTAKINSSDPVSHIFNSEKRFSFFENSVDFDVEIYYTYEKISIIKSLIQPIDAAILALLLVLVIIKMIRTKQQVEIDKLMIRANIFLILELSITLFLIVGERSVGAQHHSEMLGRYSNVVKESCLEVTDIVYKDFFSNVSINDKKINNEDLNLNNKIKNLNTVFFIDSNGNYNSYPISSDETLKNMNFETNRKLLNGKDKNIFYQIYDLEKFSIFTGTLKIVDANGMYMGTMGVNIKLEKLYDFAKRMCNKENLDYKIEINEDNSLTKTYNSGKKETLNINMTEENRNNLENKAGAVVERSNFIGKRYIFFESYSTDKKYLLEISFESTDGIYRIVKSAIGILIITFITIIIIKKLNREYVSRKIDVEKEIREKIEKIRKEDAEKRAEDKDLIKKIRIFEKIK